MLDGLKKLLSFSDSKIKISEKKIKVRKSVAAKYDAAMTTNENRRHWANADSLSVNAATIPEVRRTLRNRSRYEIANNSYAAGMVRTLANDTIGTGARLQMQTPDPKVNEIIEQKFWEWAEAIYLADKLRTMRVAKVGDGESFGMFVTNPKIQNAVKLDLRVLETDQIATPWGPDLWSGDVDGIEFDKAGNPVLYHVLKDHPGDTQGFNPSQYNKIKADAMIHYFRQDRPGQARGIPEITSALPLFAQLRRYTLAVIAAAEVAADISMVLQTDAPPDGQSESLVTLDAFELERRMATVLPGGWKLGQTHAEQPVTTYAEFKKEILNEIARCLNMPYNVAAANSSGYNYASGRLDFQVYFKAIRVEQSCIERSILDRIFYAWLSEASLVEGTVPQSLRKQNVRVEHSWFWDGHEHVDPAKEAGAQETRLMNNTTTLAEEYAKRGKDWEQEIRQRAKEINLMKELGLNPIPGGLEPEEETSDTGGLDEEND